MERYSVQLDIETLIHSQSGYHHEDDVIHRVIGPESELPFVGAEKPGPSHHPDTSTLIFHDKEDFSIRPVYREDQSRATTPSGAQVSIVKGTDIDDLPTEYKIRGLYHDELPVIGTYIDKKITPGFKYRLRETVRDRFLFGGKALHLLGIGRGYAKRITFEGESLNYNSNFFYSDSSRHGYGFSITAVEAGDQFLVCDEQGFPVGQGMVVSAISQKENVTKVKKDGAIIKQVAVHFTCDVTYGSRRHGLLPLCSEETIRLSGTAIMVKPKGCKKAITKAVQNVELPNYGPCVLSFK